MLARGRNRDRGRGRYARDIVRRIPPVPQHEVTLRLPHDFGRVGGRLGPIEVVHVTLKDFVAMNHTWETQFKFLPLIRDYPVFI